MTGVAYVAGMVVPLVILALLLEKIHWDKLPLIRTKTVNVAGKQVLVSDMIAGILFFLVGMVFIALAATDTIVMGKMIPIEATLGQSVMDTVRKLRTMPGAEPAAAVAVGGIIFWLAHRFFKERKKL
jgi:hypothetical protein